MKLYRDRSVDRAGANVLVGAFHDAHPEAVVPVL